MSKCALIDEFLKNRRKYVTYKHQFSKKSNNERIQRIIKFLQFCCSRNVKRIKDIQKSDYDEFLRHLSYSHASETVRKYKLAISELVNRANLDFEVAKNIDKQKEKKFFKLKKILKDCGDIEQCRDEIMKLF